MDAQGLSLEEIVQWLLCDRMPGASGFTVSYAVLTRRGLYFDGPKVRQRSRRNGLRATSSLKKKPVTNRETLKSEDYEVVLSTSWRRSNA